MRRKPSRARPGKPAAAKGRGGRGPAGGRNRRASARHRRTRRALLAGTASLLALVVGLGWFAWPSWRLAGRLGHGDFATPSQVFGQPYVVREGAPSRPQDLVERLVALGYRPGQGAPPEVGRFLLGTGRVQAHLRSFPTVEGRSVPALLEVSFAGDRIRRITLAGEEVDGALLDPPRLGLMVGDQLREHRPVDLSEIPRHVVLAVLAAEDATFFEHPGISLSGVVRAAWVNLRRGQVLQGGSTLTQQLVKNLYLTPERTLSRKAREGLLSLIVEMRFDKEQILEAYLNSIYWGRSGKVSLIGLGAAARAWLGSEAGELDVAEAALLAGMIRSPGHLDPRSHPTASLARRGEILRRMLELGWLEQADYEAAATSELRLAPAAAPRTRDYFLDAVHREAAERFGVTRLRDGGYSLLTTVQGEDQAAARAGIDRGISALEEQTAEEGLQAALVSIEPASGAILAYVGGRDYGASQFDRVSQARRQPGSAFKPIIFAAALAGGVATPASLLEDAPLVLRVDGRAWSPQNADRTFRGWVTARQALEQSINVATVRLAWGTGWKRVITTARQLGIESPLGAVPSLALGAFEVRPLELATAYATLAAGGRHAAPHMLRGVLDSGGAPLPGKPIGPARQAIPAEVAYVTSYLLQGVLDRGTARSARRLGIHEPLAGKTGTSNDGRDSWFVGYSPDRCTLVWTGYDDNRETRLSGARAALPLWAAFTTERRPHDGYRAFEPPPGVRFVAIDPETGARATDECPSVLAEAFVDGTIPDQPCPLHGGAGGEQRWRRRHGEAQEDGRERRSFWKRIFR